MQLFSKQVEEHGEVDGTSGFFQHILKFIVLHIQLTCENDIQVKSTWATAPNKKQRVNTNPKMRMCPWDLLYQWIHHDSGR